MGMSASQVRFLSLQNRKHSITNQLSTLSNRKLALSRDMNAVSRKYTNALNQINLRWSNNCGVDTTALSYDLMMKPNDINTAMPYMITDHHGRVVVDDEKIWFDKENCRLLRGSEIAAAGFVDEDGNSLGMSYKEVAELISTYSGMGAALTNAEGKVIGYEMMFEHTDNTGYDSNTGYPIGGKAIEKDAWKIMNGIEDFDFSNNLRYMVFEKMGLIGAADKTEFNRLLKELYGSQEAKDSGYNISTNSMVGIGEATDSFGQFQGDFTITGGCAMGNLALAKKYLEEYEIYLNTPIRLSLTGTEGVDLSTVSYDNKPSADQGVTNRLMNLLTREDISTNSTDMVNAAGIFNAGFSGISMLGDINCDIFKSIGVDEGSKAAPVGLFNHDTGTPEQAGARTGVVSWEDVYQKSYMALNSRHQGGNGEIKAQIGPLKNTVKQIQNAFAAQVWGDDVATSVIFNQDAAEYAYYMTVAKFANNTALLAATGRYEAGSYEAIKYNIDKAKDTDLLVDTHSEDRGRNRDFYSNAMDDAYIANGVGTDRDCAQPDDNVMVVSMKNLINTFVTFYNAYVECQGVPEMVWKTSDSYGGSYYGEFTTGTTQTEKDDSINNMLGAITPSETTTSGDVIYTYEFGTTNDFGQYRYIDNDMNGHDDLTGYSEELFDFLKSHEDPPSDAQIDSWYISRVGVTSLAELTSQQSESLSKLKSDIHDIINAEDGAEDFKEKHNELNKAHAVKYNSEPATSKTIKNTYDIGGGQYANEIIVKNKKSDGTWVMGSRTVTFGTEDPSNKPAYSRYEEHYDENGNFLESIKYSWDRNNNEMIYNTSLSDGAGHSGFLAVQVKTPQGDYLLGAGSGQYSSSNNNGSVYTDYLNVMPKDDKEIRRGLEGLVDYWQQEVDKLLEELSNAFSGIEGKFMQYFDALFERVAENGWTYDSKVEKGKNSNAANYLDAMLQNNMYMVTEARELNSAGKFQYTTLIAQNVKKIYQVHDSNAENLAFSEYEADKSAIQSKEKIIDARMQRLETEQEAINTEMESIKKVRNENIEKTFKIFA